MSTMKVGANGEAGGKTKPIRPILEPQPTASATALQGPRSLSPEEEELEAYASEMGMGPFTPEEEEEDEEAEVEVAKARPADEDDEEEEEEEDEELNLPPAIPSSSTIELSSIHPDFHDKFRPGDVVRLIQSTLQTVLTGQIYDEERVDEWISEICTTITDGVLSMGFQRYKIIVQTMIGELRGQSVSVGSRTLMDLKSDSGAAWTFQSDTLFATTNVYGLYYY